MLGDGVGDGGRDGLGDAITDGAVGRVLSVVWAPACPGSLFCGHLAPPNHKANTTARPPATTILIAIAKKSVENNEISKHQI